MEITCETETTKSNENHTKISKLLLPSHSMDDDTSSVGKTPIPTSNLPVLNSEDFLSASCFQQNIKTPLDSTKQYSKRKNHSLCIKLNKTETIENVEQHKNKSFESGEVVNLDLGSKYNKTLVDNSNMNSSCEEMNDETLSSSISGASSCSQEPINVHEKASAIVRSNSDEGNCSQISGNKTRKTFYNNNKQTLDKDFNVDDFSRNRSSRGVSLPPKLCPLAITNNTSRFLSIMSRQSEVSIGKTLDVRRLGSRCSCKTCLKASMSLVSKSLPNLTTSVFLSPLFYPDRCSSSSDQQKSKGNGKITDASTNVTSDGCSKLGTACTTQSSKQLEKADKKTEDDVENSPESESGCSPPKGRNGLID